MPILVLQERVVEMIWLNDAPQSRGQAPDLDPEVAPLVGAEPVDGLDVALGDEHALAHEVLVAVQHEPPERALDQNRS